MQRIDYIIIAVYFVVTLSIGAYLPKWQTRQRDFFLAGRSMHWSPIGLSVMVTAFSAINYTAFLARYGVDQAVVQRYFTARSLKDVRFGFHLNYAAAILSLLMLALMGFAIHSHAIDAGILGKLGPQPVSYFWAFIQSLPAGMTGLIGAGLLAASMSSLDSGIHSCSTAFITDFYTRFSSRGMTGELALNRLLTVIFGIFITGAAMSVGRLGSIFEIANKIINGFGSPLLAVFLLGLFSRRANSLGMFLGGLLGAYWRPM